MNSRKLLMGLFLVLSLIVAATTSWAAPPGPLVGQTLEVGLPAKQIAAPPEDILAGTLALPEPAQMGIRSRSAMIPVQLAQGKDGLIEWESDIPVDHSGNLSMMVLAPGAEEWQLNVQPPGEQFVQADSLSGTTVEQASLGIGDVQFEGNRYNVAAAQPGLWRVKISTPLADGRLIEEGSPTAERAATSGYLLVSSDSPYRLYSHLSSYELHVGKQIGLVAYVYDDVAVEEEATALPAALSRTVASASVQIQTPAGEQIVVPMYDDGQHADGAVGDGVFGALLEATTAGEYQAQVIVSGQNGAGQPFLRTSEHIFPVIEPALRLSNRLVRTMVVDNGRLQINLRATVLTESVADVNVIAEVWGRGPAGRMIPVAAIGGIVTPVSKTNSQVELPLTLDGRWLARAGVRLPLELRNVRIQDMATYLPIDQIERIPLQALSLPATANQRAQDITDEMLMGARPAPAAQIAPAATNAAGVLMLVHGYCSGGVWPTSHFSNYAVFQDYNQNRSHDQFARLIRDFGNAYSSFGIVAHSQGGAASLHLYTYYWSGLDYSSGSRLIQSVGTPYRGTALAGNLALLGDIFGVGCGTNWDLTYDGAALWLSGIPSWARNRVYYSTTSFRDRWWAYDYCQIASDLFLDDPDDGVVERWAGQLSGAYNMGHKTGWCHTSGMRDPGQTTDYSRNANMNTYANR